MDTAVTPSSASKAHWAQTFAGVLFAPSSTMRRLAERAYAGDGDMGGAVLTVCLASALDAARATASKELGWLFLNIPAGLFTGVLMWLAFALLLALLSACFNAPQKQMQAIFVTTGWSFAPWLLMAPVWCYHNLSGALFILLACVPLVWMLVAQVFAVKETFRLQVWQTLVLVFLVPFLYSVFSFMQFAQVSYVALSALFG